MTVYKVIFSPRALDDIEKACGYYNEQQKILANVSLNKLKLHYNLSV